MLTTLGHLCLLWDGAIQSAPCQTISRRPLLIASSHLRPGLASGFFHFMFGHHAPSPLHHATCSAHLILLLLWSPVYLVSSTHHKDPLLCSLLHSIVTSVVFVLYCTAVRSRRICPWIHCNLRLIVQNLVFSRSYLHRQVSTPETLVVKGGTTWARSSR